MPSLATGGLPAAAGHENLTVVVATTPDRGLVWTSWQLGDQAPPFANVPIGGQARFTDVAPAVAFRVTEGGFLVHLSIKGTGDDSIYEALGDPNSGFNEWTRIPGLLTKVSPAVSSLLIMVALAEPPDDLLYLNFSLLDQPPDPPPPGYWAAIMPPTLTAFAPAIAVIPGLPRGDAYIYIVATSLSFAGPNSRLQLNQGSAFTPGSLVGWQNLDFESNLSPAMATANNRVVTVGVAPDGVMWYNWWDYGGGGHGWQSFGDDVKTTAAPAVSLVDNGNYMFVVARGLDGEMYVNQGIVGGSIVGWEPMT